MADNDNQKVQPGPVDGPFEDILSEAPLASVQFTERAFTPFDADQTAQQMTAPKPKKRFGKRKDRKKDMAAQQAALQAEQLEIPTETPAAAPTAQPQLDVQPEPAGKPASASVRVPETKPFFLNDQKMDIDMDLFKLPEEEVGKAGGIPVKEPEKQDLLEQTTQIILPNKHDGEDIFVEPVAVNALLGKTASQVLDITETEEEKEHEEELFEQVSFEKYEKRAAARAKREEKERLEAEKKAAKEEEDEDKIHDPDASRVDTTDYDLYEDKKHFFLSDYKKLEDYLGRQSRQGYHYVRHEGKHYYFHKGEGRPYYYEVLYFASEPVESQWDLWKEQGWELIGRSPAKNRKEAGWFIVRNEEKPGVFRQTIENEEEKYRFFRKYSNSCRSTLFLLFICMVTCAVMAYLQYMFRGYLAGIIFSCVLFAIALWVFLMYSRMLRKSKKMARLLQARIRLAKSEHADAFRGTTDLESDSQLDEDWEDLDTETQNTNKKGRRKNR